ncbi:acyl-CoA N-acyltransferase [Bisporella sp. PMI_857]|nr:acyl-CoA N-acyltransferase [Bisporella sp. PMI_857]
MGTLNSSFMIEDATEADIPSLGIISALCYLPEPICVFFFRDWPDPAPLISYFTLRITSKLADPHTRIIKISDTSSKEVLGFVSLTFTSEDLEKEEEATNPGGNFVPPPGFNIDFAAHAMNKLKKLDNLMRGKPHYLLTSLNTHPKHQRKGLGTSLVERCLEIADHDGLPIFLNSFPGAHDLYARSGFEDVEHIDVDLSEWGKKWRGYGIYRTFAMLRNVPKIRKQKVVKSHE